jgi:hypothetical protein
MDDGLTGFEDYFDGDDEEVGGPQVIGNILAELLAHYQARFPGVNITVVEVPAAA